MVAMALQCYIIGLLNSSLQVMFSRGKPGTGARQWSMAYLLGCALATITVYCNCFGEQLWKGSPCWVPPPPPTCMHASRSSLSLLVCSTLGRGGRVLRTVLPASACTTARLPASTVPDDTQLQSAAPLPLCSLL